MRRRTSRRLLRHRMFNEESIYRVISEADGLVELEVVQAPQLEPGSRFHLTADAVRRMSVVEEEAEPSGAPPARRDQVPRPAAAHNANLRL